MRTQEALDRLKLLKGKIKPNTYRTIVGQIKAGSVEQAIVGIERIERRYKNE